MIRHFMIGFILGGLGGIYLLCTDTANVLAMLSSAAAPTVAVAAFLGIPASIVGVGAALTGMLFAAVEAADTRPRRHR